MNGQLGQLHKADMFSLGATLLELATRSELPAGGQQYQDLRAGKLPLLPTCTQRFANMVRWGREACGHAYLCWDSRESAGACLHRSCQEGADRCPGSEPKNEARPGPLVMDA